MHKHAATPLATPEVIWMRNNPGRFCGRWQGSSLPRPAERGVGHAPAL